MSTKFRFDAKATKLGYGAIDIVVNVYTPEAFAEGRIPTDDDFRSKVRIAGSHRRGVTIEQYLDKMDRAGIERSFLIAVRCGDLRVRGSTEIPYEWVAEICRKYPHRFSGLAGIDPTRGIAGLKELDVAVKNCGFVGAHFYPHWFGEAPDSALRYPYYARCAELNVPINWPAQAVHYANTFGQDKFPFGTDWSVIDPERAMAEVMDLDFRPEPLRKILRDNAIRIFNLKG